MKWRTSQHENRWFLLSILLPALALSFTPPGLHASSSNQLFDSPLSYYCLGDPIAMVMDDFNGDGHLDAALAQVKSGLVIFLGDGGGHYSKQNPILHPYPQTSIATGDLDGDGDLDLAISYFVIVESYYDGGSYSYGGVVLTYGNGDGTFSEEVELIVDYYWPTDLVLEDLDGDNVLDMVVTLAIEEEDDKLALLHGQGDGTFSEPEFITAGNMPTALGLADLDWDGDTDLIVTNYFGDSISVLLNDGYGAFPEVRDYPAGDAPSAVLVADLDQAGGPDVAVTNDNSHLVSVLYGSGTGEFSPPESYSAMGSPNSITAGDIDGDGYPDLVVGSSANHVIQLMINDRSGGFAPGITHMAPQQTSDLTMADVDEDGDLDLCIATDGVPYVTGYYGPWKVYINYFGRLSVLINPGDGSFLEPESQAIGNGPTALDLCDLNEDTIPDLAAVDSWKLWILTGNGDASFSAPVDYEGMGNLTDLATGDLNGDGHLDIAAVAAEATSIFLGNGNGDLLFGSSIDAGGQALQIADLNVDGNLDLVLDSSHILLGNGDGTFEVIGFPGTDGFTRDPQVAIGDLNGDGVPDLAVRYMWLDDKYERSAADVWFGNGDGTFSLGPTHQFGFYHGVLHIRDLDQDGLQDLIVAYRRSWDYGEPCQGVRAGVWWGRGDGTFSSGPSFVPGVEPSAIHVDDLNGDGLSDLAVTGLNSRNVAVMLNEGNRAFEHGISFTCGNLPQCLDTADLDGDGDVDLVTGNEQSNEVSILLNSSIFRFLAAGPGPGEQNPPLVRLFDPSRDCATRSQWQAYGVSRYGVNVAVADLDGDGRHEVLTGAGPGEMFGPHVRGFWPSGDQIPGLSFLAYGTHRYGVNVAAADLDGDGRQEIITGAGPGAEFGPHVRGWMWDGGKISSIPGISYFAYGTPKWGVNVAGGDIDGDGYDEIITGAGPGAVYGPHVRGWNWDDSGIITSIGQVSFLAYGTNRNGVNVTSGDIDSDGIDEIVTGAGPSYWFSPNVRGWNWDGTGSVTMIPDLDFFAYNTGQWGVNVSCGDLDGDGIDEIVTGQGPGPALDARVRGWNYDGNTLASIPGVDFSAYDPTLVSHGVTVAAGRTLDSTGQR